MNKRKSYLSAAAAAAVLAMWLVPASSTLAVGRSGSDAAFNDMIQAMAPEDTGSQWFNYYVETLNQEIAFKESSEPYGAAGPNGPLSGFDGYLAGFSVPDTGSRWFNMYVDAVHRDLRARAQEEQQR